MAKWGLFTGQQKMQDFDGELIRYNSTGPSGVVVEVLGKGQDGKPYVVGVIRLAEGQCVRETK